MCHTHTHKHTSSTSVVLCRFVHRRIGAEAKPALPSSSTAHYLCVVWCHEVSLCLFLYSTTLCMDDCVWMYVRSDLYRAVIYKYTHIHAHSTNTFPKSIGFGQRAQTNRDLVAFLESNEMRTVGSYFILLHFARRLRRIHLSIIKHIYIYTHIRYSMKLNKNTKHCKCQADDDDDDDDDYILWCCICVCAFESRHLRGKNALSRAIKICYGEVKQTQKPHQGTDDFSECRVENI